MCMSMSMFMSMSMSMSMCMCMSMSMSMPMPVTRHASRLWDLLECHLLELRVLADLLLLLLLRGHLLCHLLRH